MNPLGAPMMACRVSNPLVKQVWDRINTRRLVAYRLADVVGVSFKTMHGWFRMRKDPRLSNFEAAVQALGGQLVIVWNQQEDHQ